MGARKKIKREEQGSDEHGHAESESEDGSSSKKARKDEDDASNYEQLREQRIKENMERMQKLGLVELSHKIRHQPQKKNPQPNKPKKPLNEAPQRRSSRIMTLEPVNYFMGGEKRESSSKEKKEIVIVIPEGENPEFYTEEQEKLLGDCETAWELNIDGYDEDGRIYDAIKGETCHQCRQKTLCQHTSCNKCELPQGQFCGDCLYTRYGENLLEANLDPKWTCPPCRDICNCSRCRKAKGWMPTGNIYNKVSKLGFKSVAHYLIKTRGAEKNSEGSDAENAVAEETPQATADTTQNRSIRTRRSFRS